MPFLGYHVQVTCKKNLDFNESELKGRTSSATNYKFRGLIFKKKRLRTKFPNSKTSGGVHKKISIIFAVFVSTFSFLFNFCFPFKMRSSASNFHAFSFSFRD